MQSGGYFRDTFNGQRLLDNNVDVARLKIKWQPTETLTLLLSGDYSEITGNGAAFKLITVTPGMPLTLLPGAQPNVAGERSLAYDIGGDPYENQSQLDNRSRAQLWGTSATLTFYLGGTEIKSNTALRKTKPKKH